jgi:hypothetical protein
MSNSPIPQAQNLCISCSTPLEGTYCHHCGEKRIEPEKDYNIFHYVRETLEQFLNFDAKVLRSYGLFISQPGQLTKAWIEGLRKPYIKPLSLFLTVAVGVHFFLPTTNVYFELLDEIREGYATGNRLQNIVGYDMSTAIQEKSKKLGISEAQFYTLAFKTCWENSKLFLIAITPFWALFLWGLHYRQHRYYLPHLIFAMHSFAFFMAIDLLFLLTMNNLLHFESIDDWWFLPLFIGYGIYLWLSLRKVYGKSGIAVQFMRFLGSLLALIVCIILYRQLVTILTVWQM